MGKIKTRINAFVQAMLIRSLVNDPHTAIELSLETGLSPNVVRGYLRALKRFKLIYLVDKATDGRGQRSIPIWKFGPDMWSTYVKTTSADRSRTYRARKRTRLENKALAQIRGTGTLGACPNGARTKD
jgi:hypothetical protein